MKLLIDKENVIVTIANHIYPVKVEGEKEEACWKECDLKNAQGIYVVEEDCIYPKELTIIDLLEEIPEEVKPQQYCYNTDRRFYKNEKYTPYVSPEERIRRLEEENKELNEITNMILIDSLGGV